MADNWLNLEHKALVQESVSLTHGIRAGIRSLCTGLYSQELLVEDLYNLSSNEAVSEDSLVEKVLKALHDRVKLDSSAFGKIVQVLRGTMSLGYLADRLDEKLVTLREAHARTLELQAEQVRKLHQYHELVMQQQGGLKRNRPSSIVPIPGAISSLRGSSFRTNTEPAAMYQDKLPHAVFQVQASSLGTEIHTSLSGSPKDR